MILKCGNCLNLLKEMPAESVDMVMFYDKPIEYLMKQGKEIGE